MTTLVRRAIWLAAAAAMLTGCGHRARATARLRGAAQVYRLDAPVAWPPLPTTGYIKDRVARATDVTAGNAVFAACVGVVGQPLHVAIPQYALWHDAATDSVKPVFVVEAEFFEGDSMFGLRQIPSGRDAMATSGDLELLGQARPAPAADHSEIRPRRDPSGPTRPD